MIQKQDRIAIRDKINSPFSNHNGERETQREKRLKSKIYSFQFVAPCWDVPNTFAPHKLVKVRFNTHVCCTHHLLCEFLDLLHGAWGLLLKLANTTHTHTKLVLRDKKIKITRTFFFDTVSNSNSHENFFLGN